MSYPLFAPPKPLRFRKLEFASHRTVCSFMYQSFNITARLASDREWEKNEDRNLFSDIELATGIDGEAVHDRVHGRQTWNHGPIKVKR